MWSWINSSFSCYQEKPFNGDYRKRERVVLYSFSLWCSKFSTVMEAIRPVLIRLLLDSEADQNAERPWCCLNRERKRRDVIFQMGQNQSHSESGPTGLSITKARDELMAQVWFAVQLKWQTALRIVTSVESLNLMCDWFKGAPVYFPDLKTCFGKESLITTWCIFYHLENHFDPAKIQNPLCKMLD